MSRVRAFALVRHRVLPVLAENLELSLRWLVVVLSRMEETQRRVLHLIHKTVLSQVADLLLEESRGTGEVYLSQITAATLLGVSRQSVNEAVGRLKDQQIVETGYRHIRVADGDKLAIVSES